MTTTTTTLRNTLRNTAGNWIVGSVGPFKVQAKVFTEPSQYGMDEDPRISKLWVAFFGASRTVLYDYDRGDLMVDHLTGEGVAEIVAAVAKAIK